MLLTNSNLWTAHPRPLPDESFSSWFLHLSQANGLTPQDLYRVAVPGAYLHSRDLDRVACPDLLKALSLKTGLDVKEIRELTFARWSGSIFDEDDGRNKLPWLPPAGREKTRKSFGQQYCPHCLAEDDQPYLRASWRIAFATACTRHHTLLCDRCPGCAEPLQPLKLQSDRRGFACPKCGARLTAAKPAPATPEYLRVQETMNRAAIDNWIDLPEWGTVHALAFFQLARMLLRLLVGSAFARPLRHQLSRSTQERFETAQIPMVKEIELLGPERRAQLLALVGRLLDSWPSNFVDACRAVGIGQRHLIKDAVQAPFVFWDPVTRLLSNSVRRISDDEMREGAEYLRRQSTVPTYEALASLFQAKSSTAYDHAEPTLLHAEYGKGRYWKLENVSPDVRQAVRLAAHREGENVAGWVEKALRAKLRASGTVIPSSDTN